MSKVTSIFIGAAAIASAFTAAAAVEFPAGVDHDPWDRLVREYVDDRGMVDYARWNDNEEDVGALKEYLAQFAPVPETPETGDEKVAGLINAYNAFTIEFILDHYPTESIRLLDDPFDGERHLVGGEKVSVDQIEHDALRPIIGWKVHSVVVCAARSCPPLLNRAYYPEDWEEKMEERYRAWLARDDLNRYDTGRWRSTVEVSRIFSWYSGDYTGENSVENIIKRFGPDEHRQFFEDGFRVTYMDYHWGLNDQSDLGKDYRHSLIRSLF